MVLVQMTLSMASDFVGEQPFLELVRPALLKVVLDVRRSKESVSPTSILLEAGLRSNASPTAIVRILDVAKEILSSSSAEMNKVAPWLGVVPSLALLNHTVASVRMAAISLLQSIGKKMKDAKQQEIPKEFFHVEHICDHINKKETSAKLGGSHFLSSFAAEACRSKDGQAIAEALLRLCIIGADLSGQKKGFISPTLMQGSCRASSTMLTELELTKRQYVEEKGRITDIIAEVTS